MLYNSMLHKTNKKIRYCSIMFSARLKHYMIPEQAVANTVVFPQQVLFFSASAPV